MRKIEKKWRFLGPVYVIGYLLTKWLLADAGATNMNVAYWVVLFAGSYGFARAIGLVVWLACLMFAPKVALDNAQQQHWNA